MSDTTVAAASDDGYSTDPSSFTTSEFGSVWMGCGSSSSYSYHAFYRFLSVPVAAGSTVSTAYVKFYANGSAGTLSSVAVNIYGCDADSPTAPATYAQMAALARTTAYTSWTPSAWTTGTQYNSPSIVSAVQEIVDRAGWASGNNMIIIVDNNGSPASTAIGADHYGGSYGPAVLHIIASIDANITLSAIIASTTVNEPAFYSDITATLNPIAVLTTVDGAEWTTVIPLNEIAVTIAVNEPSFSSDITVNLVTVAIPVTVNVPTFSSDFTAALDAIEVTAVLEGAEISITYPFVGKGRYSGRAFWVKP